MERRGLRATVSESYPWLKVIGKRVLLWNGLQRWSGICLYTLTCLRASRSVWCISWTTVTPFQSVCPTDEQLWQAGRFVRGEAGRMQYGSWSRASRKPARPWACSVFCWRDCGAPHVHSPVCSVHLTSVTFGCSTKDSGVILGMSMWIWQQHGEKNALNTHMHTHTFTLSVGVPQCSCSQKKFLMLWPHYVVIYLLGFLKLCNWSWSL